MSNDRMHYDDDPIVRSEEGVGQVFGEVVESRLSRRELMRSSIVAGLAAGLAGALPTVAKAARSLGGSPTGLDFKPLVPKKGAGIQVAENYSSHVVVRWGDPLTTRRSLNDDPTAMSATDQRESFGYNCDFVGFFPLPVGSQNSDHGLLGVNHEYINPELMFPVKELHELSREQVNVCMEAVGFGVVEIKREGGTWHLVIDSPLNKRVTGTSALLVTGPAKGHERMKTSAHPTGTTCTGTMHNCAAGKTPWGTVLSGEENFQGMFGYANALKDARDQRSAARYGLGKEKSEYEFERHLDRFNCSIEPNEANHFGWVVEIDPYDPNWQPRKRTSLGRFRHEAATSHVTKKGRVVMYSGDDARFEYVYKFVCAKPFNTKNREANRELLDDGTLYVARFNDDGSGDWLPLIFGQGPLSPENGFRDQGDVMIDTRIAADLVGATKMDRPEDIEVNPVNEKVYVVCTNNTDRGKEGLPGPDKANPRPSNSHGHIIELTEDGDDHASTRFRWEFFLVCGKPDDPSTYYAGFDKSMVSPISCPDNICFDARGNLWIATDGQSRSLSARDGFFAVPTEGPERGRLVQFMETVEGSEVCGPEFTPDGCTAFLAIQHPGEGSLFDAPSTRWPDGIGVPRPSVIAIEAHDRGVIGSVGNGGQRSRRSLLTGD